MTVSLTGEGSMKGHIEVAHKRAIFLFGDASVAFSGATGRVTALPSLALQALGEALSRSHRHMDDLSMEAREGIAMPGNRLVH